MLLEKATPDATHSSFDSSLIGVELLLQVAFAISATDSVRDGFRSEKSDERLRDREDDCDDFFPSDKRLLEEVLVLDSDILERLC